MTNPAENQNTATNQAPAVVEKTQSERFTMAVMQEFSGSFGHLEVTNFQKKLAQNYFIKLDMTLKDMERKRMAKTEQYRDSLAFTWNNVNMQKLAVDVVAFTSIGLDPMQPNHINLIPYKNNSTLKYDIGFIIGYKGTEIKAKKYGLEFPKEVIVELVYKNDKFQQIKKDKNNDVESYIFEVLSDFNRGELIGGFYYHSYDNPAKNRIRVFTKADIDKRKPSHASAEFWGGEKDVWKNGQKVGTETIEGWQDEMAYKTIYRAAYNAITIDSEKIDEALQKSIQMERDIVENKVALEITNGANKEDLNFKPAEYAEEQMEITSSAQAPANNAPLNFNQEQQPEQKATETPTQTDGPGF